ncbi:hypothetical protein [Mycolicibacterium nivoides]|uniref:Uncharacterized protein n=1 Tax=Mycolicibacterium nivoides TaxID=2487344 RepID=A0ABW9L7Y6_9MYCO
MSETTIEQPASKAPQLRTRFGGGVLRRSRGRHHKTGASLRVVDIQRSTSNEILVAAVNAPVPELDALVEAYESALRASVAWAVSA